MFYHEVIFFARRSSRRGLLGKIFDKLRIQGRMQIFEKKSQKALNHVLIGQNDRSRCADFAGIFIIEKGAFCVELRPFYCSKRILVPMSYITFFDNLAVLVPYMSYSVYFHKLSNYMGKRQLRIQECQFLKSA